jgi:hypothetical protein
MTDQFTITEKPQEKGNATATAAPPVRLFVALPVYSDFPGEFLMPMITVGQLESFRLVVIGDQQDHVLHVDLTGTRGLEGFTTTSLRSGLKAARKKARGPSLAVARSREPTQNLRELRMRLRILAARDGNPLSEPADRGRLKKQAIYVARDCSEPRFVSRRRWAEIQPEELEEQQLLSRAAC